MPTTTTYRTDYVDAGGKLIVDEFGFDRLAAQRFARRKSAKIDGSVYVIASDASGDLGQRIYRCGYHETDDDYPHAGEGASF